MVSCSSETNIYFQPEGSGIQIVVERRERKGEAATTLAKPVATADSKMYSTSMNFLETPRGSKSLESLNRAP